MKMHACLALCAALVAASAPAQEERLWIIDKDIEFVAETPKGKVVITRTMTPCAKNKGWLQEMVPEPGVSPVGEIEILGAIGDRDAVLVDMRSQEEYLKRTIPGSVGIPYTEVSTRLDELGCTRSSDKWDCSAARKVYAFCNGPVCPQSPTAIHAMVREGFPPGRIYYYRGGMLDWDALGLTTVEGDF
ncbi:MAG: rhodanese-like domain-containing protein [Zoogloeaceae bacterium]|nr:rhodanese-like domain-containing protein [Zoogloeaceae bacterium]